ncbi:MAG: YidC/Oxa1 family membrane protein insertase [Oscillospiraceae bacterium]|nr:YidC/Oxa1 family membrane protein insertase [Oscillospiraceae bacterium]
MSFGEIITWPFAKLMVWLYGLTGSYGWAVVLFALIVNLILTPFMGKSKKATMKTTRLQPKIQEIQRRHEGNQQKLNEEMQKLYREEGINPMSGCLWSLIPFPILIALYSVIRQPLSRMMFVAKETVAKITEYVTAQGWYTASTNARTAAYSEIQIVDVLHKNWDAFISGFGEVENLVNVDFSFLGMNLGDQPNWQTLWQGPYTWAAIGIFLIPFVSAGLSWLSMTVSQKMNPQSGSSGNDAAAASMKSMNVVMPLMSIWICFVMPAAMGVYWIANSVFGMIRDVVLTKVYTRQIEAEDAERIATRSEREKELEAKKAETERLKAEGLTQRNDNTSKKKIQAKEKQMSDERKAAAQKAEKAERRERLGIAETEVPASQVGHRRYARGRAYDPDRFGTVAEQVHESEKTIPELEDTEENTVFADSFSEENVSADRMENPGETMSDTMPEEKT